MRPEEKTSSMRNFYEELSMQPRETFSGDTTPMQAYKLEVHPRDDPLFRKWLVWRERNENDNR